MRTICGTQRRDGKSIQNLGWNTWREKITRKTEHIYCQNYLTSVCWKGYNTTSVNTGQFSATLWTQMTASVMNVSCLKGHLHQWALLYSWYFFSLLFSLALSLNLLCTSVSPWDDNVANMYNMAADLWHTVSDLFVYVATPYYSPSSRR
jgi:hypothetical protein